LCPTQPPTDAPCDNTFDATFATLRRTAREDVYHSWGILASSNFSVMCDSAASRRSTTFCFRVDRWMDTFEYSGWEGEGLLRICIKEYHATKHPANRPGSFLVYRWLCWTSSVGLAKLWSERAVVPCYSSVKDRKGMTCHHQPDTGDGAVSTGADIDATSTGVAGRG